MKDDSKSALSSISTRSSTALTCIILSIWLVDRPLSTWLHANTVQFPVFQWLTHIPDPIAPLAGIGLALAGIAGLLGWRPGPRGRALLACGLAVAMALMIKEQLKLAFGRTWPETWIENNPSWIRDGLFLFQPFHGGRGWSSFPSGHTALIAAPAAILWQTAPYWRWLWALAVTAVAVGLLGANYHWLSDILAGGAIGIAAGAGALAIVGRHGKPCDGES